MGTRSYIGKDIGNGKYSVIFCQLESYLETTGRLLTEHYNTPEKVDALLALGDICFLGEKIEPDPSLPHDWYGKDYQQDVTLAFGCALPGFVDSKNEEKTERNAGYLVVSQSGGGMLRQGTREGIRRTPANRGMRAHRIVKGLDISEDVCHGMCP